MTTLELLLLIKFIISCAIKGWLFRFRKWIGCEEGAILKVADSGIDPSTITYSQVWEDPRTLRRAIHIGEGEKVISVASGGDNVLALLLDNPRVVIGIDYSPAQVSICELKRHGIKHLEYEQFLCLVGVGESSVGGLTREEIYFQLLREHLPEDVRQFWDEKTDLITDGLIHAGLYEKYFRDFARLVRPLAHSADTIRRLLSIRDPEKQQEFFDKFIDTASWRIICRFYFGDVLIGRCPPFYEKANVNVGQHFLQRLRHVMRNVPAHDNHYIEYVLLGDISGLFGLPEYLQPQNFSVIKSRIDNLQLRQGDLVDYLAEHKEEFDVIDLSNIFDFVPDSVHMKYRSIVSDSASLGARVIHWRFVPVAETHLDFKPFAPGLHVEKPLSLFLNSRERAWFYQSFVVQRVLQKNGKQYRNGVYWNNFSIDHKNDANSGYSCGHMNGVSNGHTHGLAYDIINGYTKRVHISNAYSSALNGATIQPVHYAQLICD